MPVRCTPERPSLCASHRQRRWLTHWSDALACCRRVGGVPVQGVLTVGDHDAWVAMLLQPSGRLVAPARTLAPPLLIDHRAPIGLTPPWRRPDRRTPGQALQARRGLLQRHVLCSWPVEHASTLDRTLNGGSGYPRKACVAASPGSRVAHYRPFLAVIQTHQGPTGRKLR